jgi:hypothetical protein
MIHCTPVNANINTDEGSHFPDVLSFAILQTAHQMACTGYE